MNDVTRTNVPIDRLTDLANTMVRCLEDQPDVDDVKAIVMLNDSERGGICLHGYESDAQAMAEMFIHLRAIFRASGKDLSIITI